MTDDRELEKIDDVQYGLDDDPNNDAEKGAALGGLGGAATGAVAGSLLGPGGAIAGAVIGGLAGAAGSGLAVGAVDRVDNDATISGIGKTPESAVQAQESEEERYRPGNNFEADYDTGRTEPRGFGTNLEDAERSAAREYEREPAFSAGAEGTVVGNIGQYGTVETGGYTADNTIGTDGRQIDPLTGDAVNTTVGPGSSYAYAGGGESVTERDQQLKTEEEVGEWQTRQRDVEQPRD